MLVSASKKTKKNIIASRYGLYVKLADRDMFFRGRTEVEIDIDGERHVFTLRPTFFRKCPEIWDQDGKPPVIRNWLARYRSLTWDDTPPQAELLPEGNGFVLRPL